MIDVLSIQQFLAKRGTYRDRIDGDYGPLSKKAARTVVSAESRLYRPNWSDERVRIALEQLIMGDSGIDCGAIDGVEGVMTQYGWEQWQNRMRRRTPTTNSDSPIFCYQRNAADFYGSPGTNQTRITPPYTLYFGEIPVRTVSINQKCAQSALRAMNAILEHYGPQGIRSLGLDRFGGCYNNRVMRGGTKLSMHAFACAIDWDPARNPLRADHRTAQFAKSEYAPFLDVWEAEGWTSLGRARDFDWMHVQAASL